MSEVLVPVAEPVDVARTGPAQRVELVLPQLIVDAGSAAVERFLEFFAARIANRRTRAAYGRAVGQFLAWCEVRGLALEAVSPLHVAAYIRTHPGSAPTVKQHLAAIRMLGDWLVVSQVLPVNPAAAVRGPKHVVTKGATPVLSPAEARRLLEAIDTGTLAGRRDRALVSVMLYSFARVSAVIGMRRQDYFRQESRGWLRLHEKGGKRHDVPAHHRAAEALDDYLELAGLDEAKAPLFQSVDPAGRRLTGRALSRRLVLAMIKRRAAAAGLPPSTCCHTFRATGITAYLSNGGTLEHAQQIAGHASPKTTKLYDRTADTITVDEIERIATTAGHTKRRAKRLERLSHCQRKPSSRSAAESATPVPSRSKNRLTCSSLGQGVSRGILAQNTRGATTTPSGSVSVATRDAGFSGRPHPSQGGSTNGTDHSRHCAHRHQDLAGSGDGQQAGHGDGTEDRDRSAGRGARCAGARVGAGRGHAAARRRAVEAPQLAEGSVGVPA